MLKINCEDFHTCDSCQSYRYDAYERHEYDKEGFNPKYGHLAFVYDNGHDHYDDNDYGSDEKQPLENITIEELEKNRYGELTLILSGVCPKCHKKYFWKQFYQFDFEVDN